VDTLGSQFGFCLGANAVDLAAGQGPDQRLQIGLVDDGNAVGLVELAGHFGQQLVGGHAHRAGEACGLENAFLYQPRQHPPAFALTARHGGEVDVHLVHPPVFHDGCNVGDDGLEFA
jgi:hypothetical protein